MKANLTIGRGDYVINFGNLTVTDRGELLILLQQQSFYLRSKGWEHEHLWYPTESVQRFFDTYENGKYAARMLSPFRIHKSGRRLVIRFQLAGEITRQEFDRLVSSLTEEILSDREEEFDRFYNFVYWS